MERDLPEGVPDAQPAGGWESGEAADASTDEAQDAGAGGASLAEAEARDAGDRAPADQDGSAEHHTAPDGEPASDPFVESAEIQQGIDPDVLTDEQADR